MKLSGELRRAISTALAARAEGNRDRATAAIDTILDGGPRALWAACAAWAEASLIATLGEAGCPCGQCVKPVLCSPSPAAPPGSMLTFEVLRADSGEAIDPDALRDPEMVARVWAMRFMTVVGNRDFETAMALFKVASSAPTGAAVGLGPWALLDMAADAVRGYGSRGPTS